MSYGEMDIMRKFTLIELLVVIAIIALLASMLFPSLQRARGIAQKTACASIIKQTSLSTIQYSEENRGYQIDSINRTSAIQRIVRYMAGLDMSKATPATSVAYKMTCPVRSRYNGELQSSNFPGFFGYGVGDAGYNAATDKWTCKNIFSLQRPSETVMYIDGPSSWAGGQPWLGSTSSVAYWYYLPGALTGNSGLPLFTGDGPSLTDYRLGRHMLSLNKSHWDGHLDSITTKNAVITARILERGWNPSSFYP